MTILDDGHKMGSYVSYSQLGLSSKWSSVEDCVGSIPNNSVGIFDIQSNFDGYANYFPTSSGMLTVTKQNGNRCYLLYTSSVVDVEVSRVWYSWYRELETVKYSWQQMVVSSETQSKLPSEYFFDAGQLVLKYATARLRFVHLDNRAFIQAGTNDSYNGDMQLTGYNNNSLATLNINVLNDNATINSKKIATEESVNITLLNGWEIAPNCNISAIKIGSRLFVNGIIKNTSTEQKYITNLPAPKDGKWQGCGTAISSKLDSRYLVMNPQGTLQFQSGYNSNEIYSFSFSYIVN